MISFSEKSINAALHRWIPVRIPNSDDIYLQPISSKETFDALWDDKNETWKFRYYKRPVTLNINDTWTITGIADVEIPQTQWLPLVQLAYFLSDTSYVDPATDDEDTAMEYFPYDTRPDAPIVQQFIHDVIEYCKE